MIIKNHILNTLTFYKQMVQLPFTKIVLENGSELGNLRYEFEITSVTEYPDFYRVQLDLSEEYLRSGSYQLLIFNDEDFLHTQKISLIQ